MVLQLASAQDHRTLIVFTETWAAVAVPTVAARLAEARAFVALRMIDRAWVRLKDLVECAEPNLEALVVAGEAFLLRGWQNQARKVALRGLERAPGHPALTSLAERASEVSVPVEDGIVDVDAAPLADLVRGAEQHMARGAFVRARTLLERARRRQPDHGRTNDLLWALAGEFTATESLTAMCDRVIADPPSAPTEVGEEPEHTESFRVDDLRPVEMDRSFPKLFRGMKQEVPGEFEDPNATPEITAVTSMAETQDLDAHGDRTDTGDDTQIARVMHRGGNVDLTPAAAVHEQEPEVDRSFNLAKYRREMGMRYATDLASDFEGPEDEDDSVVIHTGAELEPETSDTGEGIELDTRYEQLAARRKGMAEEAWAAPAPKPAPPPPPAEEVEPTDPGERNTVRSLPRAAPAAATDVPSPPRSPFPPSAPNWQPTAPIAWPYWVVAVAVLMGLLVLAFSVGATVLYALQELVG